ncbi:MAG: YgiQ family radical SAM protein [Anaerotardibacter sp.]
MPISPADMEKRGWDCCDFVYICGDAYVDHPSFGMAIITRVLEANGYKVGVICQPDWKDPQSISRLGKPRLGFLVSAGNMDSMVNHYTVAKKRRKTDLYSPGSKIGLRPDNACVVYGNLIKRVYKDVPIILGGVEASLRRLAHYDYWADKLKRSIILDANADMVIYGMGELSIVEVADALNAGIPISEITWINGTAFRAKNPEIAYDGIILPSYEDMTKDKINYARSFKTQYQNLDPFKGKPLIEQYETEGLYIVQNPAQRPLSTSEMDATYRLPYARTYHPIYEKDGGIPAIKEVKFSLTSNRGCMGECAFCSLAFHQGRIIQSRSHESIIEEAQEMMRDPEFKGYIHDVGGPTANFREPACPKQTDKGACINKRCLSPKPCKSLRVNNGDYFELLRKLRALPGVKKVFVRSGIRFDYLLYDKHGKEYIKELAQYHVSGQLRLAPEHVSNTVLTVMGKPANELYQEFVSEFDKANKELGLKQYVLPYLMSSHPGSTLEEAVNLAEFCRDMGFNPEQISDFYPTPSTISTCIYYTGVDPRTMEEVYCPRNPHEKAMQKALIQYRNPANKKLVLEALKRTGRQDLIGYEKNCLVRPEKPGPRTSDQNKANTSRSNVRKPGSRTSKSNKNVQGKAGSSKANKQNPSKTGSSKAAKAQIKAGSSKSTKAQTKAGSSKPTKAQSSKANNQKSTAKNRQKPTRPKSS